MKILVTGCAGFIGFHISKRLLLNNNISVYGLDNMNQYYDINLKQDRLKILKKNKIKFIKLDIRNEKKLKENFKRNKYDYVIHLAAQAGVRHSIENPKAYVTNNIDGFFNLLDNSRLNKVKHFIFASTSSVYGDNKSFPLQEESRTDSPLSFYAATKKSNEVMAYSYSNIFKLPTTGLRFFTVYGPYGRPDMSLFKFTKGILKKSPIDLFNNGNHIRDFTYIDDVVDAIYKIIKKPSGGKIPYAIYNIGSNKPEKLMYFLSEIEKNLKIKSIRNLMDIQKGDVLKTHADTTKIRTKFNFKPKNNVKKGIKIFINWYKSYYN